MNAKDSRSNKTRNFKKKGSNRTQKEKPNDKGYDTKSYSSTTNKRCGGGDNDPSWYTRYPGIYSATSNISFNQPLGVNIDMFDPNGSAYGKADNGSKDLVVPSVLAIRYVMCPGVTLEASSLINTSMFQNYNFVRHANSGSKNYDAPDLQMYLLAVDTALTMYMFGCRAYGLLSRYSAINRSIPRVFFKAMGLDYEAWTADPAQLRARLNLQCAKLSSLKVPVGSTMLSRHLSLVTGVYADGDSEKNQMVMFTPSGYHTWGRASQVGSLTYHVLPRATDSVLLTPDAYFDIMDSITGPLLEDEDINIMSGDILKAYGYEKCVTLSMVDESYVTPIYSLNETPFLTSQIENLRVFNDSDNPNFNITQSTNGHILFEPEVAMKDDARAYISSVKPFLNARTSEVTNEAILEMTRLQPVLDARSGEAGGDVLFVRSAGTEIPTGLYVVSLDGGTVKAVRVDQVMNTYNMVGNGIVDLVKFDWHPFIYIVMKDPTTPTNLAFKDLIGDLYNYTTVSKQTLSVIHDTAVASELLLD